MNVEEAVRRLEAAQAAFDAEASRQFGGGHDFAEVNLPLEKRMLTNAQLDRGRRVMDRLAAAKDELARARAREAREARRARPAVEVPKDAKVVQLRNGLAGVVVRVNAKSVTVRPAHLPDSKTFEERWPLSDIVAVQAGEAKS
jgi:hypothetical protein